VSDFYKEPNTNPDRAPLELLVCTDCGLVQLRHSVERDRLYRDYWYQSATNETMIRDLREVTEHARRFVELKPGDVVLDIGANDGTLLANYPADCKRVGFEPSNIERVEQVSIIRSYFPPALPWKAVIPRQAKIITSIAMFYDLDEPRAFVEAVKDWLAPDGVWVVQFQDISAMLACTGYDNVCHEHVAYYGMQQMLYLLRKAGLAVADVVYTKTNGGSLRVVAKHAKRIDYDAVPGFDFSTHWARLLAFADRVQDRKGELLALLEGEWTEDRLVLGLGASTKGNTTLQYLGLGADDLPFISDRNPRKAGLYCAGSNIPVLPEESAASVHPDSYLVLPWHFLESLEKREARFLANGGRFLLPLPQARLVGGESNAGLLAATA
jgi:hypothetical protein